MKIDRGVTSQGWVTFLRRRGVISTAAIDSHDLYMVAVGVRLTPGPRRSQAARAGRYGAATRRNDIVQYIVACTHA